MVLLPHEHFDSLLQTGKDSRRRPRQHGRAETAGIFAVLCRDHLAACDVRLDLTPHRALGASAQADDAVRPEPQSFCGFEDAAENHGHALHESPDDMFLPVGGRNPDQRALHFRAQIRRPRSCQVGQGQQSLRSGRAFLREQVHIVVFVVSPVLRHSGAESVPEDVAEPAQADSAGGICMNHVKTRNRAAVTGHFSRRIQNDLVRHGHCAKS